MPVLDRPTPMLHEPHDKRPTLVTAEALEFLSRNLARLAVRLRSARHVEQREEYIAFVDTVAIVHDRAALDDLAASDEDERAGRLHKLQDVRAELGLGADSPHRDREARP